MPRKRAFTLIELLVVVAIIALLIAILLPSLSKARDRAKTTACQSNERSLYQAMTNYSTEWDGIQLPYRPPITGSHSTQKYIWCGVNTLGPDLGLPNFNPADADSLERAFARVMTLLHCPAQIPDPNAAVDAGNSAAASVTDYTYNQNMGDDPSAGGSTNTDGTAKFPLQKTNNLGRNILLLVELHPYIERGKNDYGFDNTSRLLTQQTPPDVTNHGPTPMAGTPHQSNKYNNMLWSDGHVTLGDPQKLGPVTASPNKDYLVKPSLQPLGGNPYD